MFISYAWHNDKCFPGQERLAEDMGAGVRSVNRFIKGLEAKGFLTIQRRGQGKTNIYTLRYQRTPDTVWQLLSQLSDCIGIKNRHCEL